MYCLLLVIQLTQGLFTAVHYAVIYGYHKILETLISNNADLNLKTEVALKIMNQTI